MPFKVVRLIAHAACARSRKRCLMEAQASALLYSAGCAPGSSLAAAVANFGANLCTLPAVLAASATVTLSCPPASVESDDHCCGNNVNDNVCGHLPLRLTHARSNVHVVTLWKQVKLRVL